MAQVHHWEELTREEVKRIAPQALILVPLGATEQHGHALPTGTDALLSLKAVELAAQRAVEIAAHDIILAPFLRIGASEHHLPFGGTISLTPATLLQVLTEAIGSMRHSGAKRIALINGHGGNSGTCHAAASTISTTTNLSVAVLDYWDVAPPPRGDFQVPGHAGRWEASLVMATRPDLVRPMPKRDITRGTLPGRGIYAQGIWQGVDGYTDRPQDGSAAEGAEIWQAIAENLGRKLVALYEDMP